MGARHETTPDLIIDFGTLSAVLDSLALAWGKFFFRVRSQVYLQVSRNVIVSPIRQNVDYASKHTSSESQLYSSSVLCCQSDSMHTNKQTINSQSTYLLLLRC